MTPNHYDVGDLVTISATFKVDGTPTDPTAVTVRVKKPDGTVETPDATNDAGAGEFSAEIAVDAPGAWYYSFTGTGAVRASESSYFIVDTPLA